MPQFVKYEMPEEMYSKVADLLQKSVKSKGKVKAGVNEVTKMVERGSAKLIIMAQDVSPEELLLHIPALCDSKKVPYTYYKDKKSLGEVSGLKVKASCIALVNEGQATKELAALVKQIEELKK